MSSDLVRYDHARQALAECVRVDDVKSIRDKAMAMQVYAKQANDKTLIDHATDIRKRAEIRAGELLTSMKVNGQRAKPIDQLKVGTKPRTSKKEGRENERPTLHDLGITHKQSHQWQKLAALPRAEQEAVIEGAKSKAVKAVDAVAKKPSSNPRKKKMNGADMSHAGEDLTKAAISIALKVREMVLREAKKLTAEDRASLLAALRYEVRDLGVMFSREFGT